jgi:hypothetical protein
LPSPLRADPAAFSQGDLPRTTHFPSCLFRARPRCQCHREPRLSWQSPMISFHDPANRPSLSTLRAKIVTRSARAPKLTSFSVREPFRTVAAKASFLHDRDLVAELLARREGAPAHFIARHHAFCRAVVLASSPASRSFVEDLKPSLPQQAHPFHCPSHQRKIRLSPSLALGAPQDQSRAPDQAQSRCFYCRDGRARPQHSQSPRIRASRVARQREVAGDKLAGRGSPSGDPSSLQRPWARGSACESGSRWGRDRRCGLPAPGSQAWPRRDRTAESPPAIVKRERWWEISSWTSFCRILIQCPINQLDAHSGNR